MRIFLHVALLATAFAMPAAAGEKPVQLKEAARPRPRSKAIAVAATALITW